MKRSQFEHANPKLRWHTKWLRNPKAPYLEVDSTSCEGRVSPSAPKPPRSSSSDVANALAALQHRMARHLRTFLFFFQKKPELLHATADVPSKPKQVSYSYSSQTAWTTGAQQLRDPCPVTTQIHCLDSSSSHQTNELRLEDDQNMARKQARHICMLCVAHLVLRTITHSQKRELTSGISMSRGIQSKIGRVEASSCSNKVTILREVEVISNTEDSSVLPRVSGDEARVTSKTPPETRHA